MLYGLILNVSLDNNAIEAIFREICQIPIEDGVSFDSTHLTSERLEVTDNATIRIRLTWYLGKMRSVVKIDLSFQGSVCPAPLDITFPVLLKGHPPPLLKACTFESSIAEKFQVMIFFCRKWILG